MGAAIGTGAITHLASSLYYGFDVLRTKRSFSITRKTAKFVSLKEIGMFKGFAGMVLLGPMTSVLGIAEGSKIPLISSGNNPYCFCLTCCQICLTTMTRLPRLNVLFLSLMELKTTLSLLNILRYS
jgi:hypothetical protein